MSGHVKLGLVLAVIGVAGLAGVFACSSSIDAWLADHCTKGRVETDPQGHRAQAWSCKGTPSKLASQLAKAHSPADRRSTPEGHFLRYRDRMIGVVPASATATAAGAGVRGQVVRAVDGGGSGDGRAKILDARERDGYGYFNPYVGGWWGTYGGPGERFRGGGPAAGK